MKRIIMVLIMAAMSCAMFAALNGYVFSYTAGTYTEITGGTVVGSTTSDDQRFLDPTVPLGGTATTGPGLPIGFNFIFDGVSFDRFGINTNGWISLGQSILTPSVNMASTSSYTCLATTTGITPPELVSRIAAMGRDLQAQAGAELMYQLIGAPGSQELVVQWKHYKKYGTTGTGDGFNFQIRLQEDGNKIVIVYGPMTVNTNSTNVHVGLRGAPAITPTNFRNLMTDAGTPSWNPPLDGTATSSAMTLNNTVYPANGTTYTFYAPTVGVLGVTPNPVNFGDWFVNFSKVIQVTLSNVGGGDFTLNTVDLSASPHFTLGTLPALPEVISPGETYQFNITYAPQDVGAHSATLNINDTRAATSVNVLGNGLPDPSITGLPWNEDFTDIAVGALPSGWSRTHANWGAATTFVAGGFSPELRFNWTPSFTDVFKAVTPPINVPAGDFVLGFNHMVDYYAVPATYKVQISSDMSTWEDLWAAVDPAANIGPEYLEIPFTRTGTFYLAWVFDGYSFNTDSWYIDDITLSRPQIDVPGPGATPGGDIPPELLGPDTGIPAVIYTVTATGIHDVVVANPGWGVDWYCWIKVGATIYAGGNPIPAATPEWVFNGIDFGAKGQAVVIVNDNLTLPVELSSFTATLTAQNFVKLNWVTQSETQMLGYRLYRNESVDQASSIMIVPTMIPATNTSTMQSYSYTDNEVEIGSTYYYWLEAVDYATSSFHGPVGVTVQGEVPPVLPEVTSMGQAYPNPFRGASSIDVSIKAGETGMVTIYNVAGQAVRTFPVVQGLHKINWDGKDRSGRVCSSGIYYYRLSTPSTNVTRKMVIIK